MTDQEIRITGMLREGIASGQKFAILSAHILRSYSKHGVTIMTVDLDMASEEAQAEFLDIVMPAL